MSAIVFSLNPVSIQVGTEAIEYFAAELVIFPLLGEKLEQSLVLEVDATALQPVQIELKEHLQLLV
jgi:hypothetical protein